MATLTEKVFLAVIIILVGGWCLYLAYKYDQKLRHEGLTPLKAFFYAGGFFVLLVGVAGVQGTLMKRDDFIGWWYFNDLFMALVKLAF